MNLLKKLTNKNLELNKKRTIVTIIGIILSVALITAVATMFLSLYKSIINFETTVKGNFHIAFRDVPSEDLKYFKENRNIEAYHQIKGLGYAKLEGSKNESKPYLYVMAYTKDSLENLTVNLIDGRLPENNHELLISNHIKTNGRVTYKIGDTITLNIGKRMSGGYELNQGNPYGEPYRESNGEHEDEEYHEELVDTKEYTYTIVGIIERPSNYIEDYSAPGYSCITYDENLEGKTDIYVRFTKNGIKNPDKVIANIIDVDEQKFKKYYDGTYTEEEADDIFNEIANAKYEMTHYNQYLIMLEQGLFKDRTFQSLGYVALVVCAIIIFTSVFCIKNSFDISIAEKTKQYGMLASIGATKKQIKQNVYYEAFKLGVIGIPLGVILGLIASSILVVICNILLKEMTSTHIVLNISVLAIIFGILLGIVTIYLSSLRSAHKASKIAPISAIRNSGEIKIKSKKLHSPKYIKKIFGIGGEVSYKNLKRSKSKYRTTVISIIVCVTAFIALSSFMQVLYDFVSLEFSAKSYNISVSYNNDDEKITDKLNNALTRDDIEDYAIINSDIGTIKDSKITKEYQNVRDENEYDKNTDVPKEYQYGSINLISLGEHQYKQYLKKLNLDYEQTKDQVIILNMITLYDQKKQDMVTLNPYNYKKGDKLEIYDEIYNDELLKVEYNFKQEFTIAAVTEEKPFGIDDLSSIALLIVSDETLAKYNTSKNYHIEYLFKVENADEFQDDIEKLLGNDSNYNLTNIDQEHRMLNSLHLLIAIFLYGFITVISLIGITNIFNTITTNMELRKREFATLKSIGMTTKEFNHMVSLESFFYGTKALLIGIPLGIILSYLLNKLLNGEVMMIAYKIPYVSILISIIVVFLLITMIMKYSINKIKKQNTIETIRNENI